jgi:dihydroorotase
MAEKNSINVLNAKVLINDNIQEVGIHIIDGKIQKIGKTQNLPKSDEIFDAKGKIVLPGIIDVHAHLRGLELKYKETFETGTRAALSGGITTVLDMQNTIPPTTNLINLEKKIDEAEKQIVCDVGFFSSIPDNIENDLILMIQRGIMGFKIYPDHPLTKYDRYDKKLVSEAFSKISRYGLPVCVHAKSKKPYTKQIGLASSYEFEKNDEEIGTDDPIRRFLIEHSPLYEREAIRFYSHYARVKEIHLHVSHLSSKTSLEQIKKEKSSSKRAKSRFFITTDVAPHHLFLTNEDLFRLGTTAKMVEPLRKKKDVNALWNGIKEGVIDIIASEHAPHEPREKDKPFLEAPSGVPGLETMLPLIYTEDRKSVV